MKRKPRVTVTEDMKKEIAEAYISSDKTYADIAVEFGVSVPTVQRSLRQYRAIRELDFSRHMNPPETVETNFTENEQCEEDTLTNLEAFEMPETTYKILVRVENHPTPLVYKVIGDRVEYDGDTIKIFKHVFGFNREKLVCQLGHVIGYFDDSAVVQPETKKRY